MDSVQAAISEIMVDIGVAHRAAMAREVDSEGVVRVIESSGRSDLPIGVEGLTAVVRKVAAQKAVRDEMLVDFGVARAHVAISSVSRS